MEPTTNQRKQKSKLRRLLEYDVSIGKYKQLMFENLVLMITSGLNIVKALEEIRSENKTRSLEEILEGMVREIRNGMPFWQTLEKFNIVKGSLLDVIRVGEESGNLAQNLQIVLLQQRKDREIKSKLETASLYPALVMIVLLIVGTAIAVFVLPRLTEVYKSFNADLPVITQYMIKLGDFMAGPGQIVLPVGVLVFIIGIYFIFIYKKSSWIGQIILLRIPFIRNALMQLEMARFGYLMYSLLDSGFKVLNSLDIISESTNLREYKKLYEFLASSIYNGDSFAQSFEKYNKSKSLLPMYARQALIAGEQTGKIKETAKQIGDTYQKEYDYTTANLYVLMEPILLIIVWIGVFVMAIAVIMPIYNLTGNFSDLTSGANQSIDNAASPSLSRTIELISDGKQTIPVYTTRGGSGIRLQAIPGAIYAYKSKDIAWYEIDMNDGSVGWVEQRYCKELPIK